VAPVAIVSLRHREKNKNFPWQIERTKQIINNILCFKKLDVGDMATREIFGYTITPQRTFIPEI
jgi:hypothetical protein